MQWTYYVVVKTEASRNVPDAIKQLTTAQNTATETFDKLSRHMTEDFQNTVIEILDQKLKDWLDIDEEGSFSEHLDRVHTSLQEIRAGLVILMDLKEGNFANTVRTLDLATEAMSEAGSTMKDAMVAVFKDMYGGMDEIERKSIRQARAIYGQLDPTTMDVSETFLSMEDEAKYDLTDKLTGRGIGSLETILEDYPDFLARQIITEFNKHLDDIRAGRSSKELFKDLLGDDEELFKQIEVLRSSLRAFLHAADFLKKIEEGTGELTEEEIKEGIVGATGIIDEILAKVLGESTEWDNLRERLEQGIIKSIMESDNDLLKDENTVGILSVLIRDLLENWQKSIADKVYSGTRKTAPSIEGTFESERRRLNLEESVDYINLKDSLKEFISQGNDPFGIFEIRNRLDDILGKSKTEFEASDTDMSLKDIIAKNLGEADLPDIISKTLSTFLVDRVDDTAEELLFEMENIFTAIEDELEKILLTEKLRTDLAGVLEMIESLNNLESMPQTSEVIDPEVDRNITIDFDFDKYFQEAKVHRFDIGDELNQRIIEVMTYLSTIWGDVATKQTSILSAIGNIEIPKQLSGSISHQKP